MLKTKKADPARGSNTTPPIPEALSLQKFLDALPCPVFYKDPSGIYLGCNQAFRQQMLYGFDSEIIGKTLPDLESILPPDLIKRFMEKETEILRKPDHQQYEATIRFKNGVERTYAFHKAAIEDDSGTVIVIAGLMMDITAAKNAEKELKEYRDRLEEMVARRSAELMATNNRLSDEIDERLKAERELQKSEERYRSIFENASAATLLIESDLTISMANAKAEKLTGFSRDDLLGRMKLIDFITPPHLDRIKLYHELRLKGDTNAPQQFEFQIFGKEGDVRDVLANVQWIPESRQTVASLLDITVRNQLQKERQQLAAVIDQSAEAIIITDPHGRVEYINQAFENLSGYKRDDCIGQTIEAAFFGDEDRKILKQMTFMVCGDDAWSGRAENLRRDGRAYTADTRIFPLCDDRGKVINLVCVKTDVTHQVQLERQLQHSHKMEAIGTLAGGIAHDFNNILGGIQGYTEISLLRAGNDDQLKKNFGRILDGCQRAKELVQNILTFSRKNDEETKPIEIQIIVKEALKLLRASIPSTIEFREKITSDPGIVRATPTQIHQVVMNLCTNASQAMAETGGVLEVLLENVDLALAQCKGEPNLAPGAYCRLTVSDTGHGMDDILMGRIFEPYFTTKEQTGGTGLGLSVVHGIVKNFGGAIAVESRKGVGTTFRVFLPRIEDTLTDTTPADISLPKGRERVLVADDELFILEILADMLSSLGYGVETANGGTEAIELFRKDPERYDVVIADLTMPKITGTQLALKIRQLRQDVPLILTTGMTFNQDKQNDIFKEFDAILTKPILYKDLANKLRAVLDKTR